MYKVSFNNRKFIVNAKDEYDAVQKIYENIYDGVSPMTYKKLRERGYNEKDWANWDDETKVKKSQEDKPESTTQSNKYDPQTHNQAKSTNISLDEKSRRNTEITSSWKEFLNKPEIHEMYERIKSKDYYSIDDLKDSEFVKQMDKSISDYDANNMGKPGIDDTEQKTIYDELIKRGSYNPETKQYDGELKQERKAVIAIGLPASGKSSTIVNNVSPQIGGYVMDSDEAKFLSKAFQETNGLAANKIHKDSQNIIKHVFNDMIKKGTNVVVPVIGDDLDKLMNKWINPLQEQGYDVEVKYQPADSKESINRVISRTIKSGRPIKSGIVFGYGDGPAHTYEQLKSMTNAQGNPYIREIEVS